MLRGNSPASQSEAHREKDLRTPTGQFVSAQGGELPVFYLGHALKLLLFM
jgi:hypothetical protein